MQTDTAARSLAAGLALASLLAACRPADHPVTAADIGVVRSTSELEDVLSVPGPVTVESVVGADWEIGRGGLINLDHPEAEEAGLRDEPEPIQIYFHALRHPERGLFLVDSGVERALHADPDRAAIRGLVASFMDLERMVIRNDTASWLARQPDRVSGVFLTHFHLDHVSGLPDVPRGTPIYAGPGELDERSLQNLFVAGTMERALDGHAPIREWSFGPDRDRRFAGVVDVFGDRTLWALHVPGHTPGSVAYLARTPRGPVLLVGDACHTAWGWRHGVEPGTFSHDQPRSAESLRRLKDLVARHPEIDTRLGHQSLPRAIAAARP